MTVSTASCWQKKKRLPTARRSSSRSNHHSSSRRVVPGTHLVAKLVDEVVLLGGCGGGEIIEELRLLADHARDAALHVLRRGQEPHRGTPALDQFRAAAGQEFVVPVRLAEGVADDDPIDDVGHVESPRHPAAASVTDSGSSTFFDASRISNRTIPPSYPKSAMTPGRTSSLSLIRSSRREITRVSVSRSY